MNRQRSFLRPAGGGRLETREPKEKRADFFPFRVLYPSPSRHSGALCKHKKRAARLRALLHPWDSLEFLRSISSFPLTGKSESYFGGAVKIISPAWLKLVGLTPIGCTGISGEQLGDATDGSFDLAYCASHFYLVLLLPFLSGRGPSKQEPVKNHWQEKIFLFNSAMLLVLLFLQRNYY
jgi:hypothetical protein